MKTCYSELEEKVKGLIRESFSKRIAPHGKIGIDLTNENLIERWLTDIMAIGFNNDDLILAAKDIYEFQKPMEQVLKMPVIMENICDRVYRSSYRFDAEIEAFKGYVELRETAPEEVVLFKVREELADIEEGEFYVV